MDNQLIKDAETWKEDTQYWKENRLKVIHKYLFIRYSTFPLEWFFFCLGIFFYVNNFVHASNRRQIYISVSPLLFFFANYFFILVFMKLSWDRYFLPPIIASKLIVAVGIYEITRRINSYLFRIILARKSKKNGLKTKPST